MIDLITATWNAWRKDKASLLAAALAFYTAVSVAPLLVLIVVIAGLVLGRQTAEGQLMTQLRTTAGPQAAQFLQTVLDNAKQPSLASTAGILSFIVLIWGSTNLFNQLQTSLNTIWNVMPDPKAGFGAMLRSRLLAFLLVIGVAVLLMLSLVLNSVIAAFVRWGHGILPGGDGIWQVFNVLVSLVVISVLIGLLFKVLPDVQITWRDVWLGAAVTGVLFTLGNMVLSWYLSNAGNAYGVLGSVVVFLLWVYYSAQILFLGAEFTQAYARRYGAGIRPKPNAISTNPELTPQQQAAG